MKNDLISRSTLLSGYDVRKVTEYDESGCGMNYKAVPVEAIENAPAVDAEPVRHGYWIPQDNTRTKFMCSDCKSRNHDGSGKYCSECGCKMDAEVNNDA